MDEFHARDLAWRLAVIALPAGSPLVFQRELQYQRYFYALLETRRIHRRVLRLMIGASTWRFRAAIIMMWRRRQVLHLGSIADADLRPLLEAIEKEREAWSHYWFGAAASDRSISIFNSIDDESLKFEFASYAKRSAR